MTKIRITIFILFVFPVLTHGNIHSHTPEPWEDAYNIDVSKVEFKQYMTVFSAEERETILARIARKQEPQYSAYLLLIEEADRQAGFDPSVPASMDIMGGYEAESNLTEIRDILWKNAYAAYTLALAYDLTNNVRYARAARDILMAWADKGTVFSGADSGLQLGSYFNPMLYAVDLLGNYPGWRDQDKAKFASWWRDQVLLHGKVIQTMRVKDNNWKDAGLLGVITAAVVFEDKDLLKEALIQQTSYFYARTDSSVRMQGAAWKFENNAHGMYLPREVVRNDGRSGLTYTAYALTTMVQHFEIARYCGFNNWHKTAANGATMHGIISQFFKWDIKGDAFFWHRNPGKSKARKNTYEIANNHFNPGSAFTNWIIHNRPLNGEQGDPWVTLTKGDMQVTDSSGPVKTKKPDPDFLLNQAVEKVYLAQQNQLDKELIPRNILPGNMFWNSVAYTSWTSGFWPGILWFMYDYTGEEKWKQIAHERSLPIAKILSGDKKDHDLGFQFLCSFGNAYRLTQDPIFKDYLLAAAGQLAGMYHPTVGTILSWPHARDRYMAPHNTIIDNLMNLELLFWAAKNGGDAGYYDIALQHASVTMQNQVRPDYTHWHVVAYDTISGEAVQKVTRQGYSDESLWARGQAWGIYGFTMVFRETGNAEFLETAKSMANVFLERLPEDFIPYWDFDAPDIPDAPRDASAAAIVASALLELYSFVENKMESDFYYTAACNILHSLAENYLSGENNYAILNHSVGNYHSGSEVDVPIIYADYYFIEALLRKKEIDNQ